MSNMQERWVRIKSAKPHGNQMLIVYELCEAGDPRAVPISKVTFGSVRLQSPLLNAPYHIHYSHISLED